MSESRSCVIPDGRMETRIAGCPDRAKLEKELAEAKWHVEAMRKINADLRDGLEKELAEVKENSETGFAHFRGITRSQEETLLRQATDIGNRDKVIANQRAELRKVNERVSETTNMLGVAQDRVRELESDLAYVQRCLAADNARWANKFNDVATKNNYAASELLADKDHEIRKLKGDLISAANGYNEDMEAHGRKIDGLEAELAESNRIRRGLEQYMKAQGEPINGRANTTSNESDRIAALERGLADANRIRCGLVELVKTRGDNLSSQAATILKQAEEIEQLRKSWVTLDQFNQVHDQMEKYSGMIGDRNVHIAELQKENAALQQKFSWKTNQKETDFLRGLLRDRAQIIVELQQKLTAQTDKIELLRGLLRDGDHNTDELQKHICELQLKLTMQTKKNELLNNILVSKDSVIDYLRDLAATLQAQQNYRDANMANTENTRVVHSGYVCTNPGLPNA